MQRRQFLSAMVGGTAVLGVTPARAVAADGLQAGEGVADITPPLGIELAGFHKPPGQERRVKAIRQPCEVRALVLTWGPTQVAICSLDVLGLDQAMAGRIQRAAAGRTGIPAENIHVVATHDHSMPTFMKLRQWGGMSPEFMATVEQRTVEAIVAAQADLAPAELSLGKCRATGGSHNRTVKQGVARTDAEFGPQSTDADRWLDTMLHALVFRRAGKKPDLVWYHFSAHAVCYADEQAGPDWPGEVAREIRDQLGLRPSFLQGHIGDVNPGDGSDWRGEIRQTVAAITPALKQAIAAASPQRVDCLRTRSTPFNVPFDMERFAQWIDEYRRDPSKCQSGQWVDAGFAADWYRGNRATRSERQAFADHAQRDPARAGGNAVPSGRAVQLLRAGDPPRLAASRHARGGLHRRLDRLPARPRGLPAWRVFGPGGAEDCRLPPVPAHGRARHDRRGHRTAQADRWIAAIPQTSKEMTRISVRAIGNRGRRTDWEPDYGNRRRHRIDCLVAADQALRQSSCTL